MSDLILDLTLWRYSTDLDFAPVGRWSATFVEQDGPSNITEHIFTLAAKADTASIRAVVDGHQVTIVDQGVIDRYEINEDPDAVTASVEGRDNKARWLDAYPTEPKTYQGLYTTTKSPRSLCAGVGNPSVTLHYPTTFHQAVADVASRIGLTLIFDGDIYNYSLGQDFVHDTTESYMQALAGLAEPLRQADRGRVDFIVDGNFLIMKTRVVADSANITIPYEDVTIRNPAKTRRPTINDVQVLGTTYQTFVREESDEDRFESRTIWAGVEAYIDSSYFGPPGGIPVDAPTRGIILWQETETKRFDSLGHHISTVGRRQWFYDLLSRQVGTPIAYARNRTEDRTEEMVYNGPRCELSLRTLRVFVSEDTLRPTLDDPIREKLADGSDGKIIDHQASQTTKEWVYINQEMERENTQIVYKSEFGLPESASQTVFDPDHQTTEFYHANEPEILEIEVAGGTFSKPFTASPAATRLTLQRHETLDYIRSGNQLIRTLTTNTYHTDGRMDTTKATETSTGRLESVQERVGTSAAQGGLVEGTGGGPVPPGFRTEQIQIKAGPDNANIKLSIPLLGTTADCEFVRQQVLAWYQSWDHSVDMGFPPYLSIAPGMTVEITDAPARWELTKFYLPSYTIERNPESMLIQTRGVAWSPLS